MAGWWVRVFKNIKYDCLSFPLEVSHILLLIPTEYMSFFSEEDLHYSDKYNGT